MGAEECHIVENKKSNRHFDDNHPFKKKGKKILTGSGQRHEHLQTRERQ